MMSFLLFAMLVVYPANSCPAPPEGEALETKLTKIIDNYSVSEKGFPRALLKAAQDFEIPLGLEWVKLPADPKQVSSVWRRATVRQIMESVANSRPGYTLEVRGGIVHVFYRGAAGDENNPLNIRVDKFEAQNEYVASVTERLDDIVKRTVSPPPPLLPRGHHSAFHEVVVSAGDHKASLEVQNGTVREVLDKMALATDAKIWVVTFDESKGLTPTGFRRTISLWNGFPIPDQYQPVWDFVFLRGTALP